MTKYISLEEAIRQNGHRHLERAISYISAGYPDRFADGSLRKAIKNFKKADELKFKTVIDKVLDPIINNLVDKVAQSIMDGIKNEPNHLQSSSSFKTSK